MYQSSYGVGQTVQIPPRPAQNAAHPGRETGTARPAEQTAAPAIHVAMHVQ